jgi:small neutral amino acid transporter SnatA (MarC family)
MDSVAQFALVTLTSLLFIVDPIAVVTAYLVITRGETPAEQRRRAMRACIAMTVLLIVFAATGNMIFARLASPSRRFELPEGSSSGTSPWTCCTANDALKKGKKKYTRLKRKNTSRLRRWRFRCLPVSARFDGNSPIV